MKRKRIATILLTALLVLCVCTAGTAGSYPRITRQPTDQTVAPGGTLKFETKASNMTGITWRLVSPVDGSWLLVRDINTVFPGVGVSGKNSETLTLTNIPAEMNGWKVFCRFSNSTGSMDTEKVTVTVTGAPAAVIVSAPEAGMTPPPVQTAVPLQPTDTNAISALGATIEDMNGKPVSGNRIAPTPEGVSCRVVAPRAADWWIMNGARIDFEENVQVLILQNVNTVLTVEAVCGNTARTEQAGNTVSVRPEADGNGFLLGDIRVTTIPAGIGCTVRMPEGGIEWQPAEATAVPEPEKTTAIVPEPAPETTPTPGQAGIRSLQPDWDMIEEYKSEH